jgi:ATP-dependent Lon protease
MIDEVDKASTSMYNGRLGMSLLPFLEAETSRRYADPYIMADVDLSAVSYIMTANDDTCLPAPLRDRCRVLRIPEPGREHVPALAASVARDIAREAGEDDRMAVLTADEVEIVGRLLGERPSVRRLRAVVERVIAARERSATRH